MSHHEVSIAGFPVELLVYVARDVENDKDLSAFSRTCRSIHQAVISTLYDRAKDDPVVMHWAVDKCRVETVKYLLAAGADPDIPVLHNSPRTNIHSLMREHQDLNIELLEMVTIADKKNARAIEAANMPTDASDVDGDYHDISEIMELDYTSLEDELYNYEDVSCSGSDAEALEDEDSDDNFDEQLESGEDGDEDSDDDDESEDSDENYDERNVQATHFLEDMTFPSRYYWTPLHAAARRGNTEIISLLLDHGANINPLSRGYCGCSYPVDSFPSKLDWPMVPLWTPLHTAICSGHYYAACLLLIRGASTLVSTRGVGSDVNCVTALHSACYSACTDLVQLLLQGRYQTDINCEDHLKMTPMSYAYYAGNWDSITWLAENGADLNTRIGRFTLFRHACFYSRFHEARRLVELGASMDYDDDNVELTALQCCCHQPYLEYGGRVRINRRAQKQVTERESIVRMLVDAGEPLEEFAVPLETPLHMAARGHMGGTVELLLAAGANQARRNVTGYSNLVLACMSRLASPKGDLLRTVKALIPRELVSDCDRALYSLCSNPVQFEDKIKVARLLLNHGGSESIKRLVSSQVLSQAVAHGNYDLADLLLDNGLKRPQPQSFSNIFEAVIREDNVPGLKYLTRKLPEMAGALRSGRLLYKAIQILGGKCARFLIKIGTPMNYRGRNDGMTCLIHATCRKSPAIAKMLLDRGADPNEVGNRSNFPLQIPMAKADVRMMNLLLDYGAHCKHSPPPPPHLSPLTPGRNQLGKQ